MSSGSGPVLIVMTGAPGLGKSTLSRALAAELGAIWLRVDTVEAGFAASALDIPDAMDAGYRALVGLAVDNLELGHTVIADAVNGWPPAQGWWRLAAAQAGARLLVLEPLVSPALHRTRVETRHALDPGTPDWASVAGRDITPWPGAHPVDMNGPVAEAVAVVQGLLGSR